MTVNLVFRLLFLILAPEKFPGAKMTISRMGTGQLSNRPVHGVLYRDGLWFFAFLILIALTQFGSLSTEVLDWDESTFALMGQSVLRGNLPYVELFDLKPPMLFIMLGGWFAVFGENLISLRLFGDLCLFITCCFTYLTARSMVPPVYAGCGALFLIALSASYFAQHTQTEHLAMAFLMPAVWLASKPRLTRFDLFWVGFG